MWNEVITNRVGANKAHPLTFTIMTNKILVTVNGLNLTVSEYIEGMDYKGKGQYLGVSKGAHKFLRHSHPYYKKNIFGVRYHFEKINP